jgi:hypothetical protein
MSGAQQQQRSSVGRMFGGEHMEQLREQEQEQDEDYSPMRRGQGRGEEEGEEEGDEQEQGEGQGEQEQEEEIPEPEVVQLSPRNHEQAAILSFAMDMRNESSFCDISFVVSGSIFRAHRVIVSAWSRWLRALLCGGDDDVVTLELFAADAFGAVLDYMYGMPILFSTQVRRKLREEA